MYTMQDLGIESTQAHVEAFAAFLHRPITTG